MKKALPLEICPLNTEGSLRLKENASKKKIGAELNEKLNILTLPQFLLSHGRTTHLHEKEACPNARKFPALRSLGMFSKL